MTQYTYFADSEYIQKTVRGANLNANGEEDGYYFLDKEGNVYSWLSDKEMQDYGMVEITLVNPEEDEEEEENSTNSCGCQCEEECAAHQYINSIQKNNVKMVELTDLHIRLLMSIQEGKIDQPPHFYSDDVRKAISDFMNANLAYLNDGATHFSLTDTGKKLLSTLLEVL